MTNSLKIALVGNPNCGKTSVFNQLTGLRQKVGNFPGVTVEKKTGNFQLNKTQVTLIDFPGLYSLFPNSQDERLVVSTFLNTKDPYYPDLVLYVADIMNLDRHLLLLTQIKDLGLPVVLALNMVDLAQKEGVEYDTQAIEKSLQVPAITISSRTGENLEALKTLLEQRLKAKETKEKFKSFYKPSKQEEVASEYIGNCLSSDNQYQSKLIGHHHEWLPFLNEEERNTIRDLSKKAGFENLKLQVRETMQRFDKFEPIAHAALKKNKNTGKTLTDEIDAVVTHPIAGPLIFLAIMIFIFQAIYAWSSYPMDWIEGSFGWMSETIAAIFPESWITSLLTDGIIAGLGGVLVFIPQIAILFLLITILEEVGYMARAVFLFDKLMQRFGLNGRSIVALISSGACAIPAIMSARTISNWKERLITIMVSPLISCSARIPVYTVLIGFVVPATTVWGIFNAQGLAFMGLYLLGIVAALLSALAFKLILKSNESSYLMIELPDYQMPVWKNVFYDVYEKVKSFVVETGKIILIMSVALWFLASYGPTQAMQNAESEALTLAETNSLDAEETADLIAGKKIEASYAGHLGKFIEPVIQPLGFDWKIGIALITSFAAREVFVGTMATIYSIGSESDEVRIKDRMATEINPTTGKPVYTMATSLSLLIFYVFAMQCMSTLAVVKRETNSWKWPIIQFLFMTGLAFGGSWLVYTIFS